MSIFRALIGSVITTVFVAHAAANSPENQILNPEFLGNAGIVDSVGGIEGTIMGDVPTLWRGFVRGGSGIAFAATPLAADALFVGSAPTQALTFGVTRFATDQGIDSQRLEPGDQDYRVSIFMRSANADQSDQSVNISVPVFDANGAFTGTSPGSFSAQVTSQWLLYNGPVVSGVAGQSVQVAFRLSDDAGEDTIEIALPTLLGEPLANQAPNPQFNGTMGALESAVTGTVPNDWRGFAVGGNAALNVTLENVAANALFNGSASTRAVRLASSGSGNDIGFDTNTLLPIVGGRIYAGQMYLRTLSGTTTASIGLTTFDANQNVLSPTAASAVQVDDQWRLYATNAVRMNQAAIQGLLALRPADPNTTLLVALPTVLGPDTVFANGFEAE